MSYKQTVELIYGKMRKALALKRQGDHTTAVSIINELLSKKMDDELHSEVLALRADLKEDIGEYEGAKEDLLDALSLIPGNSYARYTLELSLGGICERLKSGAEATSWYQKALLTSFHAEEVSGGTALMSFLRIRDEAELAEEERALCTQVALKSWKLLQLSGEPDLNNLKQVAERLIQVAGGQIS
jgi:tetratricopeptide (TPR) repeat protein